MMEEEMYLDALERAQAQLEMTKTQLKLVTKDAGRYQWLRDHPSCINWDAFPYIAENTAYCLDDEIDLEMSVKTLPNVKEESI